MPAADESPDGVDEGDGATTAAADTPTVTLSRRRALGLLGGSAALGGLAGYTLGARPLSPVDCSSSAVVVEADEWSFPAHDRRHTAHAPASAAPDALTERWRVEWDVDRHGPPAVANDMAFVAGAEGQSGRETLYAFDRQTGAVEWRRQFTEVGAASGVVAAGDSVYYHVNHDERGRTAFALAMADGRTRWRVAIPNLHAYPPPLTLASGKTLVENPTVGDAGDSVVTAVDARTGRRCWQTHLDIGELHDTPGVANGRAYYTVRPGDAGNETAAGALVALDVATGEVTFRVDLSRAIDGPPVLGPNHAYVAAFDGALVAVSLESGETVWQRKRETQFGTGEHGREYAQPSYELGAVTRDALVARLKAHTEANDRLRAFDPVTGELRWTRVAAGTDAWFTSPTAAGDDVFVAENRADETPNRLLRLDAQTGERRESVGYDTWTHHSPSLAAGTALFVTGGRVVAFGS